MSSTQFVFSADSADLLRQSKSVAQAAKQIEKAHVDAGRAANMSAAEQLRAAKQLEAIERRQANQLRRDRLETARRATRFLPGSIGSGVAGRIADSGMSAGGMAMIGRAATALGGVAIAATAAAAAWKVVTAVAERNTQLQSAQDRAAAAAVNGIANASQEFVKNTGALGFFDKQRIVAIDIPQLQRELKISGFNDLVRAVGAATSAGGSPGLALDATRQAALLYPFDPAAVQDTAVQLALIAKSLGEQNAQLAAGIVLKTNEFSPIKDIGQLAQALPSIFSSSRRMGASQSEFTADAKFAATVFANIASETADKTGEETKTLLRTLIPLINRFFADRADVGTSLADRFAQLSGNAADRAAFLGQSGVPGGSQRNVVEALFTSGSVLNTNVTNTAGEFANLSGAVAEYNKQITELTATTKLAVQQQRLALEREQRTRDPGEQARGSLRELLDRVKELSFSDQAGSIARLGADRFFWDNIAQSDSFRYGSSEQVNASIQKAIERQIKALEAGGLTTIENLNVGSLRELADIANNIVEADRGSRVERARAAMLADPEALDRFEKSIPRGSTSDFSLGGIEGYRRELALRDRHDGGNRLAEFNRRQAEEDKKRNNALRYDIPTDPIERQVRLEQIAFLEQYRKLRDETVPGAMNAAGQAIAGGDLGTRASNAFGNAMVEALTKMNQAAEALVRSANSTEQASDRLNKTANNLADRTAPQPSPSNRTGNAKSDRAANR